MCVCMCVIFFFNFFPDMVNEFLYADDTLVIALDDARDQGYMTCIAQSGARKLEVSSIGCDAFISKPDFQFIQCKRTISYLGAWLFQWGLK